MALTTTEEALVRQLIAQNSELLSLAENQATIISKLGATKKNLGQISTVSSLSNSDILFVRQGSFDKTSPISLLRSFVKPDQATETTTGVVELATAAEVLAGTDTSRVATPAGLLAGLLGAGGTSASDYIKIPYRDKTSGVRRDLIIQWAVGATTTTPEQNQVINFPIAFPTACLAVFVSTKGVDLNSDIWFQEISYTASSCTVFGQYQSGGVTSSGATPKVFAIGY